MRKMLMRRSSIASSMMKRTTSCSGVSRKSGMLRANDSGVCRHLVRQSTNSALPSFESHPIAL